ncbi:MAG: phosphatase PAP2 family protein [Treponema sp.]|jgi:membrane-associated phospholipid phosphatase|nr:phosphatase PAP2 family protein [Treponema sp.]
MNAAGYISAGDIPKIYRWGIELIRSIQSIENPVLTVIIRILTNMGSGYFYIPVILLVLWCVDEKQGLRLGLLMLLSVWVNGLCKAFLKLPRPYHLDPAVARGFEKSCGLPSGHAQLSLTFSVLLASRLSASSRRGVKGKTAAWIAAILFSGIVAFTRLYLGLHFPADLPAGWLLGGIILAVYRFAGKPLERLVTAGGTRFQLICAALIAWGMNALGGDRSLGGLFLGFGLGYGLMAKYFPFSAQAAVKGKKPEPVLLGARYVLGMTGAILLYAALGLLLPGERSLFAGLPFWGIGSPYYELGYFIRYGLVGLWASAGAPRLFLRLGLAELHTKEDRRG